MSSYIRIYDLAVLASITASKISFLIIGIYDLLTVVYFDPFLCCTLNKSNLNNAYYYSKPLIGNDWRNTFFESFNV